MTQSKGDIAGCQLRRHSSEFVLVASEISKSFGATRALRDVTLMLRRGETHALLGENGAGKSTLVKILAGATTADSGTIEVDGREIRFSGVTDAIATGVVPIYQELSLFPHLSIAENIAAFDVASAPGWRSLAKSRWRHNAERALGQLGLKLDPSRNVDELSLGERQLVEIARALSRECAVLILDEPTASLTDSEARQLFNAVKAVRDRGSAVLLISHRLDEVFSVADRVSVLRDGALVMDGVPRVQLSPDKILRAMIGRNASQERRALPVQNDQAALTAKGVSGRRFREFSLVLNRGEVVGLAGLMGSGATEIARALAGDGALNSGEIKVGNFAWRTASRSSAAKAGVGYVPGERALNGIFRRRPVRENISASILGEISHGVWLLHRRELDVVRQQVKALGVKPSDPELDIDVLSGGNQQKVLVSRILASRNLKVIVGIEPTRGVDMGAREEIHRALLEVAAQGVGMVIASSDLDELSVLCHRVIVVREGSIVADLAAPYANSTLLGHLTGAL